VQIPHRFSVLEGEINLDKLKILCLHYKKYAEALLCFEVGNANISFAKIKLFDSDRWVDAEGTYEGACRLGDEIVKRWNAYEELESLKAELADAQKALAARG